RERVVVEADDEAREDVDAMRIDAPHAGEHVLAQVLRLAGLAQALGLRRFDADEDPAEAGRAEEAEQLRGLRAVERGLGADSEAITVPLLVLAEEAQQLLRRLAVADEVVVDEEDAARARGAERVELAADLRGRLAAGLAAEHHDDVAELALERAAARELQR